MQDDDSETQVSSAPTIFTNRPPAKGGHLDDVAAHAADIVPDQMITQGTGPIMADGKTLVDGRISNKHFSPC